MALLLGEYGNAQAGPAKIQSSPYLVYISELVRVNCLLKEMESCQFCDLAVPVALKQLGHCASAWNAMTNDRVREKTKWPISSQKPLWNSKGSTYDRFQRAGSH